MEVLGFAAYFYGVVKSLYYYSTWSILSGDLDLIISTLTNNPAVQTKAIWKLLPPTFFID